MTSKITIKDTGVITKIYGLRTSSSNMPYRAIRVVLNECGEQEFMLFGGRATLCDDRFKPEDNVEVTFSISSRKYTDKNGADRINTQLNLVNISKLATQQKMVDSDECPFGY
jgi:hypothetical protein